MKDLMNQKKTLMLLSDGWTSRLAKRLLPKYESCKVGTIYVATFTLGTIYVATFTLGTIYVATCKVGTIYVALCKVGSINVASRV